VRLSFFSNIRFRPKWRYASSGSAQAFLQDDNPHLHP
jgi:hypothetical protein